MPEYLSPGVYIEEIRPETVAIEGVGTSTAGFVGQTVRGPESVKLITSWLDFQRWYGGLTQTSVSYLPWAVRGFFDNGGQRAFVARVSRNGAGPATLALGPLTVTAVGAGDWGNRVLLSVANSPSGRGFRLQVMYFDTVPDPWVDPFAPGSRQQPDAFEEFDELGVDERGPNYVLTTVNGGSQLVEVAWADPNQPGQPPEVAFPDAVLAGGADGDPTPIVEDYTGGDDEDRGLNALAAVDEVALLCVPDEVQGGLEELTEEVLLQCERLKDRFAVVQVPSSVNLQELRNERTSEYGAKYVPWVRVFDPITQDTRLVPPGGHVLGIYARTDELRGVHKAPANEEVRGIVTRDLPGNRLPLQHKVTKGLHDILNPRQINVIRDFRADGRGIRVWGARTMADDPQWRYVNVRRLFIFLEESIDEGTQIVVFEPNHEPTWAMVRRSVTNFLTRVWRDGALHGVTPEEAFFVRCDRTTMTQDDIDNGRLICLIGVAPVRPAEFVIFRISQKTLEAVPA
jgi:uncharacterized protein